MFEGIPFLDSPFPWVFLCALAAGAAIGQALMPTRRARDPDGARTRKWIIFCLLFSLAIALGLAALLVAGPQKIRDPRLAYLAAATAVAAMLAFRFKKALGIPILLLLVLVIASTGLFLRSLRAFTGETEIAKVRVISAQGSRMKLELVPLRDQTEIFDMEGDYFAPIVKVVIFDDLWVFLGVKTWYRFVGLTSFRPVREGDRIVYRQGNTDHYLPHPEGISERLYSYFESNETRIPGVKSVQINLDMKKAEELISYSIRVENDGGVEIVADKG